MINQATDAQFLQEAHEISKKDSTIHGFMESSRSLYIRNTMTTLDNQIPPNLKKNNLIIHENSNN